MRVKCVICDEIGQLKDDAPLAKKLETVQSIRICVINATNGLPIKRLQGLQQVTSSSIAVPIPLKKTFNNRKCKASEA